MVINYAYLFVILHNIKYNTFLYPSCVYKLDVIEANGLQI